MEYEVEVQAFRASDSDEETTDVGDRQRRTRKLIKAYLLNEETLEELKFGADLTKDQLPQVKQMLMSHSQ